MIKVRTVEVDRGMTYIYPMINPGAKARNEVQRRAGIDWWAKRKCFVAYSVITEEEAVKIMAGKDVKKETNAGDEVVDANPFEAAKKMSAQKAITTTVKTVEYPPIPPTPTPLPASAPREKRIRKLAELVVRDNYYDIEFQLPPGKAMILVKTALNVIADAWRDGLLTTDLHHIRNEGTVKVLLFDSDKPHHTLSEKSKLAFAAIDGKDPVHRKYKLRSLIALFEHYGKDFPEGLKR